jgi:hypothetical protein
MVGEFASVGTESSGVRDPAYAPPSAGMGWTSFAIVMLGIAGAFNAIHGIAAISNSTIYARDSQFILSDLKTWGWVLLILGVAQIGVAAAIWAQTEWGRWLGVLFAGGGAIVQLLFMPAYPFASLAIFAIDILIVYGLVAHGGRQETSF